MTRNPPSVEVSILELIVRTHKFIRYEMVHAAVALAVFGAIFLILKPWDNSVYYEEAHPFWFVGPPIVYFTLDLFFAMYLHFALKNELLPRRCLVWICLQIANLILLTVMGFCMVWTFYDKGNTHIRLILALLVLYCFKSYRISKMHKLIVDMQTRCTLTLDIVNPAEVQAASITTKSPVIISSHHHRLPDYSASSDNQT